MEHEPKNYNLAIDYYNEAITLDEEESEFPRFLSIRLYYRDGRDNYYKSLEAFVEKFPYNEWIPFQIGNSYLAKNAVDYENATTMAEPAVSELHMGSKTAMWQIGETA